VEVIPAVNIPIRRVATCAPYSGAMMPELQLDERFVNPTLDPRLAWHCEPSRWKLEPQPGRLRVEPDAKTDFWQRTHYGFQVDNGHFLFTEVAGPFRLGTRVRFAAAHQY